MGPRWRVKILYPPQKFDRPIFCNIWNYGTKNDDGQVTFHIMKTLLTVIKIYQLVQIL
jgi:hypothetical protein